MGEASLRLISAFTIGGSMIEYVGRRLYSLPCTDTT